MLHVAECPSIDGLAEEFLVRRRRGERPTMDEYVEAYPNLADEIRELFPAILIMEEARGHFGGDVHEAVAPVERFGDFRIVREVGRGGMGVVYEAVQESLDRRVALKLLPRHLMVGGNQVERFHREVQAVAGLHHSNIIPVFGVGQHEGLHYYVMQLIDGLSLDRVLAELRPRHGDECSGAPAGRTAPAHADHTQSATPANAPRAVDLRASFGEYIPALDRSPAAYARWVARIGIETASALHYAHRRGVLHRDVKPSNLLLDYDGRVWIGDFGLAKIIAENQGEHEDGSLTASGEVVGTIRYMAPERFQGRADARSDVYGLGLILYELLTLRNPFDAQDRLELMHQVVHREPPPPIKLDPRIPPDLQTIVLKALDKDPRRRYGSAADLAADLQRFHDDRPIRARRVGMAERAWRWCKRNPLAACLAAVIVFLTSISFAAIALKMDEAVAGEKAVRQERDQVRAAHERLRRTMLQLHQAYYAVRINLANNAWESPAGLRRTRELLEMLRPADGEEDHRGFEWHYLYRLSQPERLVLRGHKAAVEKLAISPDGSRLVSVARGGEVWLWDAEGRPLLSWQAHGPRVGGIAFSPDGATIATAGAAIGGPDVPSPSVIRLWDARTGQERRTFSPHLPIHIRHLAFDSNGKRILVGGNTYKENWLNPDRHFACFMEVETGAQLLCIEDCGPTWALSPDGKLLAAGALPTRSVKLFDAHTGEPLRTVAQDVGPWSLAFSPNNRVVAAGHARGLTAWDVEKGTELFRGPKEVDDVRLVVFSAAGDRLAACSHADFAVHILDAKRGRSIRVLKAHDGPAADVAFRHDGQVLATCSSDRTIALWDLAAGQAPFPLEADDGAVQGLALSQDGQTLISHHQRLTPGIGKPRSVAHAWDLRAGKVIWSRAEAVARGIARAVDGEQFATWTEDGLVTLWSLDAKDTVFRYQEEFHTVRKVLLSADGLTLAVVGHTGNQSETIIRDARTGTIRHRLAADGRLVQGAALSPDGARLAEASSWSDGSLPGFEIVLWDLTTGQRIVTSRQPGGGTLGVLSVFFSGRDGRWLATTHPDGAVRIWDSWSCTERYCLRGHAMPPSEAAFTPDGRQLATASFDQTVRLWDVESGHELLTIKCGAPCNSLAFNADGTMLVVGSGSRILKLDATPVADRPDER